MKEYSTDFIRNIALVSHSSAGKTMLAEALLHFTGATTRLGNIQDGSTVADFEDEEIRRGITLSTAIVPIEYQGLQTKPVRYPRIHRFCRRGDIRDACRGQRSRIRRCLIRG